METLQTQPTAIERASARLKLLISYDAEFDTMTAIELGEVVDGQFDDEVEVNTENFYVFRRGPGGRIIGFGVTEFSEFGVEEEPELDVGDLRFDVPTLGLWNAGPVEVIFAAQATLGGYSTPDVVFFRLAVEAAPDEDDEGNDLEEAEIYWRQCLATGDMKAHFGLGYTLLELDRPHESYGHLRTYTEVNPRNASAWMWRGKACEAIEEPEEAATCYRRAIELEEDGSFETDAEELLEALERRCGSRRGPRRRGRQKDC
jgi:tetratricopeptide (TPR) repeat protein